MAAIRFHRCSGSGGGGRDTVSSGNGGGGDSGGGDSGGGDSGGGDSSGGDSGGDKSGSEGAARGVTEVMGPFSSKASFTTRLILLNASLASQARQPPTATAPPPSWREVSHRALRRSRRLLFENAAVFFMLAFALVAVALALLAKQFIDQSPSSHSRHHSISSPSSSSSSFPHSKRP